MIKEFPDKAPCAAPTFYRTYSRVKDDGSKESYEEVVARTVEGLRKLGGLSESDLTDIYNSQREVKVTTSGRWMWVGGTDWLAKPQNSAGSFNCFSLHLDRKELFFLTLDLLGQGGGVGAVIEREGLDKLDPIIYKQEVLSIAADDIGCKYGMNYQLTETSPSFSMDREESLLLKYSDNQLTLVVGDSRLGWVDAYRKLWSLFDGTGVDSYGNKLEAKSYKIYVDYSYIRPKGTPIKGFGGKAQPEGFPVFMNRVGKLLNEAVDAGELSTRSASLLCCEAGKAIVAGGVRRSAEWHGFDSSDEDGNRCKENLWVEKDGKWIIDPERDAFRMANHTRIYHHRPTLDEIKVSVAQQHASGEGAIMFAPESIARCNQDVLPSRVEKDNFIQAYVEDRDEARRMLSNLVPGISEYEMEHRMKRYNANPCFRGDMKLLTSEGYKTFEELDGTEPIIINSLGNEVKSKVWCSGEKEVVELRFRNYPSIFCTPDHVFLVDHSEVQAKDLKGRRLTPYIENKASFDDLLITDVEYIEGTTKVYDFTEPETHWGVVEGVVAHNCVEILGKNLACNLSLVHLESLDPTNEEEVNEQFRIAALAAVPLLKYRFTNEILQESRELDPIVAVCFTGLFDFLVAKYKEPWLQWWMAGRPKDWGHLNQLPMISPEEHLGLTQIATELKPNSIDGEPLETPVYAKGMKVINYLSELFIYEEARLFFIWKSIVRDTIEAYCEQEGLKIPNRVTAIQPSGTKGLLSGGAPGWHPSYAQYYIRRITFGREDPVAMACMSYGYNIIPGVDSKKEDGSLYDDIWDPNVSTWLVEIPIRAPWSNLVEGEWPVEDAHVHSSWDLYMQVQKHYATFNCFSRDTKFVTDTGIKSFEDYQEGDTVNVIDANGNWSQSKVVKTSDLRDMYEIVLKQGSTGKIKVIKATGCHRFPVRKKTAGLKPVHYLTTLELKPGYRLVINDKNNLFNLDKKGIQNGIVYGDGCLIAKGKKSEVRLCHEKRELAKYFEKKPNERDDLNQSMIHWLDPSLKSIPSDECSVDYLAGFVAGLLATDGNISGSTISICSSNRDLIDFLIRQVPRLGVVTTGEYFISSGGYENSKPAWQIRFSKETFPESLILRSKHRSNFLSRALQPRQWKVVSVSKLPQQDYAWCVMEPNTNHFTLEDNILVMNTSATINFKATEIDDLSQYIYEAIQNNDGYVSAALLAGEKYTFPRMPYEKVSKEEYERLMAKVMSNRITDDFLSLLAGMTHEQGEGPGGCSSDKCEIAFRPKD